MSSQDHKSNHVPGSQKVFPEYTWRRAGFRKDVSAFVCLIGDCLSLSTDSM